MPLKVGDALPQATFRIMTPEGPVTRTTDDVFKGRKIVLFAVPGAFTPTCDKNHLPGFLARATEIKGRGIDAIVVTAVNDVFVMDAWAKTSGAAGVIEFLADGNADFAKALGMTMDRTGFGMGTRSARYSMIVEDGIVRTLNMGDTPGTTDVTGADNILTQL